MTYNPKPFVVPPEIAFGLYQHELDGLRGVYARYPEVISVRIYGSRARGDFRNGSDIDMAVVAPGISRLHKAMIADDLDNLGYLLRMDVHYLHEISNQDLLAVIDAEGQLLYPAP
jgi:uncharacterized protein